MRIRKNGMHGNVREPEDGVGVRLFGGVEEFDGRAED